MNDENENVAEQETVGEITDESKNGPRKRVIDGRPFLKEALRNLPPRYGRNPPRKSK